MGRAREAATSARPISRAILGKPFYAAAAKGDAVKPWCDFTGSIRVFTVFILRCALALGLNAQNSFVSAGRVREKSLTTFCQLFYARAVKLSVLIASIFLNILIFLTIAVANAGSLVMPG